MTRRLAALSRILCREIRLLRQRPTYAAPHHARFLRAYDDALIGNCRAAGRNPARMAAGMLDFRRRQHAGAA